MSFPQKLPPAWLRVCTEDAGQNHRAVFLQRFRCIKRYKGLGWSHLTWLWHSGSVAVVGPSIFMHWPAVPGASPRKTFLPCCCHAPLLRRGSAFCSQARASFCPCLCCRQLLHHATETSYLPQPSGFLSTFPLPMIFPPHCHLGLRGITAMWNSLCLRSAKGISVDNQ